MAEILRQTFARTCQKELVAAKRDCEEEEAASMESLARTKNVVQES